MKTKTQASKKRKVLNAVLAAFLSASMVLGTVAVTDMLFPSKKETAKAATTTSSVIGKSSAAGLKKIAVGDTITFPNVSGVYGGNATAIACRQNSDGSLEMVFTNVGTHGTWPGQKFSDTADHWGNSTVNFNNRYGKFVSGNYYLLPTNSPNSYEINALKTAAANYSSFGASYDCAWLGTPDDSSGAYSVVSSGLVSNYGKSYDFVLAPAFNLKASYAWKIGNSFAENVGGSQTINATQSKTSVNSWETTAVTSIITISDANDDLTSKNKTLSDSNDDLTSKNKSLTSKNKSLTSKVSSLTTKNKSLTSTNSKLKASLAKKPKTVTKTQTVTKTVPGKTEVKTVKVPVTKTQTVTKYVNADGSITSSPKKTDSSSDDKKSEDSSEGSGSGSMSVTSSDGSASTGSNTPSVADELNKQNTTDSDGSTTPEVGGNSGNTTLPTSTTTTSSGNTGKKVSDKKSKSNPLVPVAALGGALGGIGAVVGLFGLFLFMRKKGFNFGPKGDAADDDDLSDDEMMDEDFSIEDDDDESIEDDDDELAG
ncbi:MAG: hypothetical protein ACI4CS_00175 [Candidatus Weimeria sp.]